MRTNLNSLNPQNSGVTQLNALKLHTKNPGARGNSVDALQQTI
jgi:hypothetical protein